jgi:hypothetical protein
MFSVYPLLFLITRNLFEAVVYKGGTMSNTVCYIFNAVILVIATIVGATYPQVGSILGYVGSFIGLGLIYVIPIAVYLKRYRLEMEDPNLVKALDENRIKTVQNGKDNLVSPKIAVDEGYTHKISALNSSSLKTSIDISMQETLLDVGVKPLPIDYKKYYLV